MARYRGTVTGNRQTASRLGTPSSGLSTRTDGWSIGLAAWIHPSRTSPDLDSIALEMTGGSSFKDHSFDIGTINETPTGPIFTPSDSLRALIIEEYRNGGLPE